MSLQSGSEFLTASFANSKLNINFRPKNFNAFDAFNIIAVNFAIAIAANQFRGCGTREYV